MVAFRNIWWKSSVDLKIKMGNLFSHYSSLLQDVGDDDMVEMNSIYASVGEAFMEIYKEWHEQDLKQAAARLASVLGGEK